MIILQNYNRGTISESDFDEKSGVETSRSDPTQDVNDDFAPLIFHLLFTKVS